MSTQNHPARAPWRRLVTAVGVGMLLTVSLVTGATAQPVPTETMLAERTNPAVQLITTKYDATVKLRQVTLSSAGYRVFDRGIAKWGNGELDSAAEVIGYLFDRVQRDPQNYLTTYGSTRTKKLSLQGVGSGFIASPEGHIVTARHVVTADKDLRDEFADQGAAAFAKSDARAMIDVFDKYDISSETARDITNAIAEFNRSTISVKVATPKVAVLLGEASASGSRVGKSQPAEVVYRSNQDLGEDVAVLRIRVSGQLPTISLGSTAPLQGSVIYANTFPAAATFVKGLSKAAQLQPTLSSGRITAVKSTDGGIQLLQTDAVISPGSSGGAAFDDNAQVIGIVVSGAVNSSGVSVGQNYLMPLDVVKDALARSGAATSTSLTTQVYDRALVDYYQEHYSAALVGFQQVKDLFPAHAYVGRYISDSQTAISQGKDKTPPPPAEPTGLTASVPLVGGGVGIVLVAGLLVILFLKRRPTRSAGGEGPRDLAYGPSDQPPTPGANGAEPTWSRTPFAPPPEPVVGSGPDPQASYASSSPGAGLDLMGQTTGPEADDDGAPDDMSAWEPIDYLPGYPTSTSPAPGAKD